MDDPPDPQFPFRSRLCAIQGQSADRHSVCFRTGHDALAQGECGTAYLLGIVYHTGIFSGILFLLLQIFDIVPGTILLVIIQGALAGGASAGIFLFLKRTFSPVLRAISCPDDFVSNILVDGFLVLALLVSLGQSLSTAWYVVAIVLFLYMPLGKIRHCAFFFTTRIFHGIFFGRRGVFPGVSRIHEGGTR